MELYGELQTLAENGSVSKSLSQKIALKDMFKNRNSIFSVMAVAGYLNAVSVGEEVYDLSIPNKEMKMVFSSMILENIHSDANLAFTFLFNGMINADLNKMKKSLDTILYDNIPFFVLSKEKNYQLIIAAAAMCLLGRYSVKLETESGNGRANIILMPNRAGLPTVILELKKTSAKNPDEIKKRADDAINQIKENEYFLGLSGRVLLYGVCFHGKHSEISLEELNL